MAGWHLSEQARQALRTARNLAPGRSAAGSADPLLVAILGQWDDEHAGGPALLRACGMTADQASQLATTLVPTEAASAAVPEAEPRIIGSLRFVVDQAFRIAAEARAPYVGTEHLVVAMLWHDTFIGAHELRRLGVSHARAAEQLAGLRNRERAEQIDPLAAVEVPTRRRPGWTSWLASRPGSTRFQGTGASAPCTTCWPSCIPGSAARRLLVELGVSYEEVVRRIAEEGARRVTVEDGRPEEHPLEGWQEFRVTDQQNEVIRGRFHAVNMELGRRGVRFMFGTNVDDPEWSLVWIHPGGSGLDPREVLDRLLGRAS